ncbi:MAG TPA: SOS response-associated peptidase family protein [Planctomycetaceae bacterium]|jgi:putative SOS response-associated peptidase YedK|nr:SOS response-associated peptidase family protein [Planctomycetaceae bacterium]
MMRWGLVPAWSKDPKAGPPLINARAETVATKPSFRTSFKHRRCLIPADGFYEWQKKADSKTKVPHSGTDRTGNHCA